MRIRIVSAFLFLLLICFQGFQNSAHAIVEVRVHYGSQDTGSNLLDKGTLKISRQSGVSAKILNASSPLVLDGLKLSELKGLGVDGIISLPLFPLAFGLRHEALGARGHVSVKSEGNSISGDEGGKVDVDLKRTAALLSWRIIDTLFFIGAIGTFGLHHEGQTQIVFDGETRKFKSDISHSYSLGIEAGGKLLGWLFGAEVGHFTIADKGVGRIKYGGTYGKIHLGVDF